VILSVPVVEAIEGEIGVFILRKVPDKDFLDVEAFGTFRFDGKKIKTGWQVIPEPDI
jgi:hypothetical protein